jgi:hypothetical protein
MSDESERALIAEDRANRAEAELARVREELAEARIEQQGADTTGFAARIALTRFITVDLPEFIRQVENIPVIYKEDGYAAAMSFISGPLTAMLQGFVLTYGKTPRQIQSVHRVFAMFTEPWGVAVAMLPGRAGARVRMELCSVVSRWCVGISVKSIMRSSQETPSGLAPIGFG